MNPFKNISKTDWTLLAGGALGSVINQAEVAAQQLVPGWPDVLKQQISPLPSNGETLSLVAPPLVGLVVAKKKPNLDPLAKGLTLFAGPKLLKKIVVNAIDMSTRPVAGLGARMVATQLFTQRAPSTGVEIASKGLIKKTYAVAPVLPVYARPSVGTYRVIG